MLSEFLKQSIYPIDAFLDNFTLGTLINEGYSLSLELAIGDEIALNDSFTIEVLLDDHFTQIPYLEVLNRISTDGWSAYAGLTARVKPVVPSL